jgi:hypothetical protein
MHGFRQAALVLGIVWLVGCETKTTRLVSDEVPDAMTVVDASSPRDTSVAGDAARPRALCVDGATCACDDGQDNDADGLIDGFDPECTGAFDHDEASFSSGAPRASGMCLGCFWEDNGGPRDSLCRYPRGCREGMEAPIGGACTTCEVTEECSIPCTKLTPNGCDCFGCCAVERSNGTTAFVTLEDTCTLNLLDDSKACPVCVQSPDCMNPCSPCELCPGRTIDRLPAECTNGTPGEVPWTCDTGRSCRVASDCGLDYYCQLGCCLPLVL